MECAPTKSYTMYGHGFRPLERELHNEADISSCFVYVAPWTIRRLS